MNRLEEMRRRRELFAGPDVPPGRVPFRWMAQPIERSKIRADVSRDAYLQMVGRRNPAGAIFFTYLLLLLIDDHAHRPNSFLIGANGTLIVHQRLLVLQSLRRALMRESVLLRILPERSELDEGEWGELLVDRLFAPLPGQREGMADRLAVFVEDLQAAGGSVQVEGTARHAMYEATRMRDTSFVALVDGSTLPERRERVFAGFNSPLLPEVLICTSVGQEGIDLHRHCRHVIHYDLAWNPAVLEQRTGRVDRIGSKTFRERAVLGPAEADRASLDVGVPFLAGTYDERMYEEIRIRSQIFEVLTGGDVAADNLEGRDDVEGAEGSDAQLTFPILPPEMIADLRVRLHVWEAVDERGFGPECSELPTAAQ